MNTLCFSERTGDVIDRRAAFQDKRAGVTTREGKSVPMSPKQLAGDQLPNARHTVTSGDVKKLDILCDDDCSDKDLLKENAPLTTLEDVLAHAMITHHHMQPSVHFPIRDSHRRGQSLNTKRATILAHRSAQTFRTLTF